jgi:hypothetical protein
MQGAVAYIGHSSQDNQLAFILASFWTESNTLLLVKLFYYQSSLWLLLFLQGFVIPVLM